jgi:dienelactone hydrolase
VWRAGLLLLAAAAAPFVLETGLDAQGRSVTFRAADGRPVNALVFDAAERPAPAVVLVGMLGRPKEDWQAVGQELASANITALAIDGPRGDVQPLTRHEYEVAGAVGYLRFQPPETRPSAIGVAGASLGATLAVLVASVDPNVRSIALISPSLDYRGARLETPFTRYGERPALLIASVHDPYAARTVRVLAHEAPVSHQVRWSETPAHGTLLLARDGELVRALVDWFQATLGVS